MTQSTFSAQVANKCLTILQGYSKTIRLLLVMFLTLTVSANVWGADYELVTSAPSDWSGEYLIVAGTSALSGGTSSWGTTTAVTVNNNNKISTTANISVTISKGGTSGTYYIYMNSNSKYLKEVTSNTFATADASSTETEWKISLSNGNAQIACASSTTRYLRLNGTSGYRCYTSATGTLPKLYKKATATSSHTITATSNNNSYGTVSVSGTTITATPNAGYCVKSGDAGYTVTSGTAVVTNNGNNTFSVTPSSNCTITINFEAIPQYTVTWDVNGDQSVTTQVTEGSKPTFPATPSSCDATSNTFYGWATATWDGKINDVSAKTIYTSANDMPAVNGAVTYYAVFATKGASGGTAFDGTSGGDFKIYALVEGEKKYLSGTGSKISPVDEAQATEYTFTKISDGVFSIKTGTTYLTYASSTNLGTSSTSYSWNISEGTNGSWRITSAVNSSRGIVYRASTTNQFGGYALSNITASGTEYYDVEIGGGASVSYSGYITSCTTEPSYSVTSTLSHVTGNAENATTINPEDNELWLSYSAESGWNLPATISVTMGGAPLSSETDYDWDNGDLLIAPASGFTGNIVVTINGWQQLAIPNNLQVIDVTSTAATLSWSAVTNAQSYTIQVLGESDEVIDSYEGITKTTYTVTDLDICDEYLFGVIAVGDGVTYYNSAQETFDVFAIPLGTPDVIVSNVTATSFTLSWDAVDGAIGYNVFNIEADIAEELSGTTYTYTFTDLSANTSYEWTVQAQGSTSKCYSEQSGTTTTLSGDCEQLGKATNLEVDACYTNPEDGQTYVRFSWTPATSSKENTSQKICFGLVGQDATCKEREYNITWAGDLASKLPAGEYEWSIQAIGDGVDYCDGDAISGPNFTIYSITYNTNGGAEIAATSGTTLPNSLPTTTREHYTFVGWYTDSECTQAATAGAKITQNTTLYAKWEAETFQITLNPNEGTLKDKSGNVQSTIVFDYEYDSQSSPLSNYYSTITRDGYEFVGWFTEQSGGEQWTETGSATQNITLYAQWVKLYTVTLAVGPGNVTPTTITETSAGEGVTLPTPTIDCGDWEFAGWAEASVEETTTEPTLFKAGDNYKPISDCELYAVYQRTEETEGGGGTENVSKSYTFADYTAGTQYAEGEEHELDGVLTLTTTQCHFTTELRIYSSGTHNGYVVSNQLPGRIISIGFNAGNKVDAIDVFGSTNGTDWTKVGQVSVTSTSYKDYTLSFDETDYTYFKLDVAGANQVRLKSITITWESSSAGGTITTTYYNSNPVCQTCENVLTISKGVESNGTFTLSKSDEIKTCDGVVDVLVTPTPAEHYSVSEITATTPATGGAPTMTDNGDGTWTVTYAQNSTGVSTINVDFVEDAKATIILSELGETSTVDTYYVGDKYTLPTTSSQSCEGKELVGWSTKEVIETDTKPTENYYELGAEVTLEAEQTFYAVFAEPTGNGGAQGELFSESFETIEGSGGNDGKWDGNIASAQLTEHGDWEFTYAYKGDECIKLGKASGQGQATTPALGINGSATLTFKAGAWNGNSENLTITLQIVGEGSIEPSSITLTTGQFNTYTANITGANADTKVQFIAATKNDNRFFLDEVKVSGGTGNTTYTAYSTSCGTYTVTFYGFNRGGCTTTCGENPAEIEVAQGATYTIPNCVPNDPAGLGRTFAGTWNTQADGQGTQYTPGEEFTVYSDITLYAQWILKTTKDIVLPTDVEDLATTDIVVTGGTTLTLEEGTTTINSLTLEGGRTNDDYLMPAIYSDGEASVELNNKTIPFDLSVDKAHYYPFAVPFPVAVNQVDYADPTLASASLYGTHYVIKRYDGANRANQGENKNANWVKVEDTETLQPGIGYIITAVPIGGEALIRFPMTPEQLWSSEGKTVDVAAYTGAAAQQHPRHAGWNFVANPYLSRFAGVNVGNEKNLLNGVLNYVNGEWQKTGEVPYVTIPAPDFSYYEQVELDNAILSPSYAFFVQAAKNATLSFATAGRQQNMPALRAAAVEPLRLPLTISQSTQSDRTTLLVSDDYTANYEIGKDLEKMFGSAEQVSLYAWSSNTPLAYCAVPWASAIQAIPLGYRTNKSGSVTIALDASADMSDAEMVLLYDAVTGMTTNLLINSYTFETEMGTHDARFTITITPKQGATTDCEEVMMPTDGTYKFLRNGQLYINHRGTVYTVEGRESW